MVGQIDEVIGNAARHQQFKATLKNPGKIGDMFEDRKRGQQGNRSELQVAEQQVFIDKPDMPVHAMQTAPEIAALELGDINRVDTLGQRPGIAAAPDFDMMAPYSSRVTTVTCSRRVPSAGLMTVTSTIATEGLP